MALYRCALCGSSKVAPETRQEGYNQKKGILGMALFGLGGAVAGASGNTVTYYHCAACGQTLNRCMPEFDKNNINRYLANPNNEANKFCLKMMKQQYHNIEWEEPTTANNDNTRTPIQETLTSIRKENSEDIEDFYFMKKAVINALYKAGIPCTISDLPIVNKACEQYTSQQLSFAVRYLVQKDVVEKRVENGEVYYKGIAETREEALEKLHKIDGEKLEQRRLERRAEVQKYESTRRSRELAVLNALYKAEKPCTISEMQMIDESCKEFSNQKMASVTMRLCKQSVVERIEKDGKAYFKGIPETKEEAVKLLEALSTGEQKTTSIDNHAVAIAILNALYKAEKPCTISEMQMIDESCKEFSNQKLASVTMRLRQRNIIERIDEKGMVYFKGIPSTKEEAINLLPEILI